MNKNFYTKLAVSNLKKNSKTYLPYIFASVFSVAMFYIMYMLSQTGFFANRSFEQMLQMGNFIVAIFSVIFLFYTNSFLIKRRQMEFGLFNVLGMDKRHIAKVISLETLFTAGISLVLGIGVGVLFSKLIYLLLANIINFDLKDTIMFMPEAALATLILFAGIFMLTLLNSLRLIHLSKPIELLRGGQKGEREPKIKWVLTVIGIATLATGYYIAVTITDPLDALIYFFVAVILVIIGTYCLFASITIFVLKLLKKNKNYYYKTSHFISVSAMMYRMKQNAVGLANICILSTIVLVTISTTVSLYAGVNDIINLRYPKQISVETLYSEEISGAVDKAIDEQVQNAKGKISSKDSLRFFTGVAAKNENQFNFESYFNGEAEGQQCVVGVVPLADYNKLVGANETLENDRALVYTNRKAFTDDKIIIGHKTYNIAHSSGTRQGSAEAKKLSSFFGPESIDTYYIVVNDMEQIYSIKNEAQQAVKNVELSADELAGINNISRIVKFNTDLSSKEQIKISSNIDNALADEVGHARGVESRAANINSFYDVYGGLLFLGLYLGILFLLATVLIIYYKQLSEGYEDKERFRIMQNVGLTKKEVRKAIRSQVLTMFFMPLIVACVHISFAFPMISKLLLIFNLNNTSLFMICMLICATVFAILYIIVYALTSRLYYRIVEEE